MVRKIIRIDDEKCIGCGSCAEACHEGAIAMVDGKARLMREDYCDGLGDCLPACPVDAISFELREAPAYDEAAVMESKKQREAPPEPAGILPCGCPGTHEKVFDRRHRHPDHGPQGCHQPPAPPAVSRLSQWPAQIKLVSPNASFLAGAKLLVAADCTAYAYASMHNEFMDGRVTLIGCPKLDNVDYSDKLADILVQNDIVSVAVVRMEVPCCGGIENAVKSAILRSGKLIPWSVTTISTDGRIVDRK